MSISEKTWQGNGLQEQLSQADVLESDGSFVAADCLRASAYYSHFGSQIRRNPIRAFREFSKAKQYARGAVILSNCCNESLTHGQCDVIGTILLRRWLWLKADPTVALKILRMGLSETDVPPHARALMTVGVAEAYYLRGDKENCKIQILEALSYGRAIRQESDQVQAHRQFCRMLRRVSVLMFNLGNDIDAEINMRRARDCANDVRWASIDQLIKIRREESILRLPRFARWFLPQ